MAERGGMRWRWGAYVPVLVWSLVVLWVGGRPNLTLPATTELPIDKLGHFGMYGILGLSLAWGWQRNLRRPAAWLLIAAGILVGAVDEAQQLSVPGRSAELGDLVADAAGVLMGFWLGARWFRRGERHGGG
jgi:VanZ family protein